LRLLLSDDVECTRKDDKGQEPKVNLRAISSGRSVSAQKCRLEREIFVLEQPTLKSEHLKKTRNAHCDEDQRSGDQVSLHSCATLTAEVEARIKQKGRYSMKIQSIDRHPSLSFAGKPI